MQSITIRDIKSLKYLCPSEKYLRFLLYFFRKHHGPIDWLKIDLDLYNLPLPSHEKFFRKNSFFFSNKFFIIKTPI